MSSNLFLKDEIIKNLLIKNLTKKNEQQQK